MPDEIEKAFVKSFIKFLNTKITEPSASEVAESLEVAIQCLEAGFELNPEESQDGDQQQNPTTTTDNNSGLINKKSYSGINLYELFQSAFINVSSDRKEQAEDIKNDGNRLMKEGKYSEALNNYNKAISLDATNPVYYCNRAAAYIRLSEYERAIADCKQALVYNPNYSKAHGRMGIAYSNMQKFDQARDAYKRALELEPENQDLQNNLRICEQRLESSVSSNIPGGGNANITNILQNTLQNLPLENSDLRQLIMDMLNDPMISMASRQLVMQVAQEYPDVISGFRQQLMDFVNVRANDGTTPAGGTAPTPGVGGGNDGQNNINRSSQDNNTTTTSNNTINNDQQNPSPPQGGDGNGGTASN